jgi:hypothetical protein
LAKFIPEFLSGTLEFVGLSIGNGFGEILLQLEVITLKIIRVNKQEENLKFMVLINIGFLVTIVPQQLAVTSGWRSTNMFLISLSYSNIKRYPLRYSKSKFIILSPLNR